MKKSEFWWMREGFRLYLYLATSPCGNWPHPQQGMDHASWEQQWADEQGLGINEEK